MSISANIYFKQPGGAGTSAPGFALLGDSTQINKAVTVGNGDDTDVVRWTYEMIAASDPTSTVALGIVQDGARPTYTFTPDKTGGYLLHLITLDKFGNVAEDYRVFQIAETSNRIIVPFRATEKMCNWTNFDTSLNKHGWGDYQRAYNKVIDGGAGAAILCFTVFEIEIQAPIVASGISRISSQGVHLTLGTRVWLNAQSSSIDNGGYIVQSGAWTRIPELAAGAHFSAVMVIVTNGTGSFWTGSIWQERNATYPTGDVVGTNNLVVNQIGNANGGGYIVAKGFASLGAGGTRVIDVNGLGPSNFTFASDDVVIPIRREINGSTAIGHLSATSGDYSGSQATVRSFKADGTAETNDRSLFFFVVIRGFGVH